MPEILVGAGTIVRPEQAKQAADAGAQFLVSPGHTPALLSAMTDTGLPHLPGVATVSEVLPLLEAGYTEMKFFPAEAAGGAKFLASIHSPVPAARFCPTGGITPETARDVPETAQRRLRRRIVAHPTRRAWRRPLGLDRRKGPRHPSPGAAPGGSALARLLWTSLCTRRRSGVQGLD